MRRKYDIRNKRSFLIISILSIAVIVVFSLFIYKYLHTSKIEYIIEAGSVVQDVNKNYISIEEDAILKKRWNDSYYLIYQDNKINLGKNVVAYNTISGKMQLYGTFYEIEETGKIVLNKDETILANTTVPKFYKLADREYLLIDKRIVSDDRSINASDYLLVELDKLGNAKLSNYKLNLKTISPTTLVGSKYSFDIALEKLYFGKKEIDLKKIIGSTNQYVEKEKKEDDKKDTDGNGSTTNTTSTTTNTNNGIANNGSGFNNVIPNEDVINNNNNTDNVINNKDETSEIANIDEIKSKTKMTSIVRVSEGLYQIDIDYVVYDPYNEYESIYVEITKKDKIDVIYLSKNDTHLLIDDLAPNTEYKLNFIYTVASGENNSIVPTTFDSMVLRTKKPSYSYGISVYKLSKVTNQLTYKVSLQEGYPVDSVNVRLSFEDIQGNDVVLNSVVSASSGDKVVYGTFDINGYDIDQDTILKLEMVSVSGEYGTLEVGKTYTFGFGR